MLVAIEKSESSHRELHHLQQNISKICISLNATMMVIPKTEIFPPCISNPRASLNVAITKRKL
jgi:hypothetical protein